MVDKAKCDQMLSNLRRFAGELARLRKVPADEFAANPDLVASAKYHFVISIEACIDIANHIISSEGFRIPKDNGDSFVVLVENGVLPGEHRDSYVAMARFRNRLVHLYWDVDDALVREYLATRLTDLASFAENVSKFLLSVKQEGQEPPPST